jgi:hypothetical protein
MNETTILKMPCIFTIALSERHPVIFSEDCPDGVQETSRFIYHASVECEGKQIMIESPTFSPEERESTRAMELLRNHLVYALANAVLTDDQKPRYTYENGVMTRTQPSPQN